MMRTAELTITDVLAHRLVHPVYQPIVDLTGGGVVGLEALARGPAGTALEFPDRLFAAARDAARLGDLDLLCCERAIEGAVAAAATPPLLFVNAEPGVLDQPLSPRLLELLAAGPPFRMVLEFTERALPAVPGSLLRIAGMVQEWGNALALDDVGVDPMSLAFLPVIEPEVIKLDMSLVRNPDTAHTRSVAALVRSEARRTGATIIAEGIETEAELRAARELGAHWVRVGCSAVRPASTRRSTTTARRPRRSCAALGPASTCRSRSRQPTHRRPARTRRPTWSRPTAPWSSSLATPATCAS
ncbi:hypothetical protein Acy02nite_71490 [Actinoplanes cyaneus]|uniref:EAL domain-containing protein n=1 Tax=Actinoplanes cyaneus TaxID=52696 RepID=A0A919ITE4_9ACTN|nr:EAL domain-containing protein [Actinoplanes cyaneus]MCW2142251.1 EAL domain, c-di-GMP-specific phosphodiesterase class I (or its enzymatically inactive variant) [Actinoplanes cyaneus]GID69268.1 hypothetical protein Acy02nite_71490 [Actinoplanes cyaneus]